MSFFKAGRFFDLIIKIPLSQLRCKCIGYTLIFLLQIVITSLYAFSQDLKTTENKYGLRIISNQNGYRSSINGYDNKRIVYVKKYAKTVIFDWKYATTDNFTGKILYHHPEAFLRLEAAEALQQVEKELLSKGIGLKIFDAYRPYSITKKMWEVVPDERYAANPAKGSGHNRGAAVDVTLVNLTTRAELLMPTTFDDFSEKAHHDYKDLPEEVIANRELLKSTMEKFGFVALNTEWWHYSIMNAANKYELLDLNFRQLKKLAKKQ
jgi:D-alanyl-D-alanine dipeptidase